MDQESDTHSPPVDAKARAKRLYANARLLEDLCPNERAKEIARDVALLAIDMLAEIRTERQG